METIIIMAVAIATLVVGFLEVVKKTFNINKRYLPITAVFVGIVVGAAAYFLDVPLLDRLWVGAIAGLMSVGLFETGKNIKESND